GGDLTQTRESLQTFLSSIQDYKKKVDRWREQAADVQANTPKWIDQASIILTIFLAWFGFSQYGLLLHGLTLQRGMNVFKTWRRVPCQNPLMKIERVLEVE